jgi:hypothetical protein
MKLILVELLFSAVPSVNLGSKSITATTSHLLKNLDSYIISSNDALKVHEIRGDLCAVVGDSAPQDGRFRVRFPRGSLEILK